MSWTNAKYKNELRKYKPMDGIKALLMFALVMASSALYGWLYSTQLSIAILDSAQIWNPLLTAAIFYLFFFANKEQVETIGLNTDHLRGSIVLGTIGGFALIALQTASYAIQGKAISVESPLLWYWCVFIIGAFEEETIFRGYIQTRLTGLIPKQWMIGIVNSILFLLIHYPTRWVLDGALSLTVLDGVYVIYLLVLHFVCDAVYKRTNCLWGAIVLHLIYNAVGAMVIVSQLWLVEK